MRHFLFSFIFISSFIAFFLFMGMASQAQLNQLLPDRRDRPGSVGPIAYLSVDRNEAELGDTLNFTVTLNMPGNFTDMQLRPEGDVSRRFRIDPTVRESRQKFSFKARALAPGAQFFGPMQIAVWEEGTSNPIPMQLTAVPLQIGEPSLPFLGELRDYTEPETVAFSWIYRNLAFFGGIIAVAGLLGGLAWLTMYLMKKRKAALEEIHIQSQILPPLVEASSRLKELKTLEVFHKRGPDPHYTELSNLLRRYLEREFKSPVLEMSEDETVAFIEERLGGLIHSNSLPEILKRSSEAKFAMMALTEEIAKSDCDELERFLRAEEQRIAAEKAAKEAEERQKSTRSQEGKAA